MTEREKMIAGKVYSALDESLFGDRNKAKALCRDYNNLTASNTAAQGAIIRELIGKSGGFCCITAPFWCDYGYNIELGESFYSNHNLVILDCAKVTFGDNVFVGPNCGFYTACHPIDAEQRNSGMEFAKPITVGDNVWFGGGVSVLPGVTIGSNVVVGAGSVVVRDIPSGVVAAGNPCKVLRKITENDKLDIGIG